MKKTLLLAGAVAALVSLNAGAAPISGEIHLSGTGAITLVNNVGPAGAATPNNADAIDFPVGPNAFVTAVSGSFSAFSGMSATMSDFAFNPTLSPSPVAPLWVLLNGWQFQLNSITLVDQATAGFLNLAGKGLFDDAILGAGGAFESTPGDWSFTVTTTASLFTWTSSNSSVPDGGATVMMLGAVLSGLGLIRRKLA